MEVAAEKSQSATVQIFKHGPIIIYTRLPAGGTYYLICMSPMNSERLIGISDAFSAFVYGYPSSCPRAHCTPNKSVTTLHYTHRHGPVYTNHACRHLPSAVPWISEGRLLWSGVHFYIKYRFLEIFLITIYIYIYIYIYEVGVFL